MTNEKKSPKTDILGLGRRIATLTALRGLIDHPIVTSIYTIASEIEDEMIDSFGFYTYGDLVSEIYAAGGDLSAAIRDAVIYTVSPVLEAQIKGAKLSKQIKDSLDHDLETMQMIADLRPTDLAKALGASSSDLPKWKNSKIDIRSEYEDMIASAATKGYGDFARYRSFKVADGELVPVRFSDPQSLDELYGYERERGLVYKNTEALADGRGALNVLLYGDAGTGKSSTIKACANAFFDKGLRLVEFDKQQLSQIPGIIEKLYDSPLKFIFYIDDLSFDNENDDFTFLKGILEGGATGKSDNIAIYATSNRRHLVRELAEDRRGSDLHLNDTLQQTMSLSARFGLTITFSKPAKDLYLEIVKQLAIQRGIKVTESNEDEIFKKAEAFAIRVNGRSPRTAKQFVQQLSIGLI